MKNKLLLAIAIVVLMLASDSPVSAESHPCQSAFVTVGCMNWRLGDYDEQFEELSDRIETLEANALLESEVANLEAQIVRREDALAALRHSYGQAQSDYYRVLSATSRINTMVANLPSNIGFVGCRTFDSLDSMYPTLTPNDLICLSNDADQLATIKVRHIVTAQCPGNINSSIHRVYSIETDGFRMKGDANNYIDPCLYPRADWKVVGIARNTIW